MILIVNYSISFIYIKSSTFIILNQLEIKNSSELIYGDIDLSSPKSNVTKTPISYEKKEITKNKLKRSTLLLILIIGGGIFFCVLIIAVIIYIICIKCEHLEKDEEKAPINRKADDRIVELEGIQHQIIGRNIYIYIYIYLR